MLTMLTMIHPQSKIVRTRRCGVVGSRILASGVRIVRIISIVRISSSHEANSSSTTRNPADGSSLPGREAGRESTSVEPHAREDRVPAVRNPADGHEGAVPSARIKPDTHEDAVPAAPIAPHAREDGVASVRIAAGPGAAGVLVVGHAGCGR